MQPKTVKTCAECNTEFRPRNSLQIVCSYQCAAKHGQRQTFDNRTKELKQKRSQTDRAAWTKKAQKAFNRYIRARDWNKPCISSGRYRNYDRQGMGGTFDAGHYRTTKSASHLRFNTLNCWGQSVHDNRDLSGNLIEYRKGLIERIGIERVERLENNNSSRSFSIEYLKRLTGIFNRRAAYYEKLRGIK